MTAPYTPGLTRTESRIMHALDNAGGELVRYSELAVMFWGYTDPDLEVSIRVMVSRVRKKLGPAAITTVWGYGYALGDVVRCECCEGLGYRRES